MSMTVEELLDRARRDLVRVNPEQAAVELAHGALLVDIRPADQRADGADIPGATVIDRNVLEWRLDPTSPDRLPEFSDHEAHIVIVCNEGYSSSLAAASLQDLGLVNATDLDGGFRARKRAGLPIVEPEGPIE